MIARTQELKKLKTLLKQFAVVGILGPRQVGKTTLARMLMPDKGNGPAYFDLENPEHLARLNDPMLALKTLKGLVTIDEVQRAPELFPVLRVLADRKPSPARFLILGSASPSLLQQTSETLAGRIAYHYLSTLSVTDTGQKSFEKLWVRGGFPRSYLAKSNGSSFTWRQNFIRTFLERDLPQLGITIRSGTLRRFWTMLANYHGQTWNSSEFGRSFGVADTTVRNYLDILTSTLMIRQLLPWHENIKKRQVKAPKIYIADSGILHALLNLRTPSDIENHPKLGASWEGFILNTLIRHLKADPEECFFWATHAGAELDLLIVRGKKRLGFEIKRTSSPRIMPSVRHAVKDLKLTKVDIIHAGDRTFDLSKNIRAVSFSQLMEKIEPL